MRTFVHLCAIATLAVTVGCRIFTGDELTAERSPLRPAQPSPDSVAMEIIWARFPAGDRTLNQDVWRDIDETQLPPAVQRELANNGLRAGVIGTQLPEPIARVLRHGEGPPSESPPPAEQAMRLATEPTIRGRVCRLRRNQRSEIEASEIQASLPLLVNGGRELRGRTYQQAQAIYALRVDPQPDRTAIVELTPELHHGPPRFQLLTVNEGMSRQGSLREREVFDRLRMTVKLAPGEMLVLMSLPDAGSRLGHYFHTVESAEGRQQKLILIRLAEVPPTDAFAA